jgi:putative FmdB family regulatory protein
MPIYEYKCAGCGHQGEHLQKVSEKPLAKCPSCGKKKYRKQISAAGFQLKGSGWYATDFKGGAKKTEEKKTETKAETKTEPKAEKSDKSEKSEKTEKKSESKSESKAASTATTS